MKKALIFNIFLIIVTSFTFSESFALQYTPEFFLIEGELKIIDFQMMSIFNFNDDGTGNLSTDKTTTVFEWYLNKEKSLEIYGIVLPNHSIAILTTKKYSSLAKFYIYDADNIPIQKSIGTLKYYKRNSK